MNPSTITHMCDSAASRAVGCFIDESEILMDKYRVDTCSLRFTKLQLEMLCELQDSISHGYVDSVERNWTMCLGNTLDSVIQIKLDDARRAIDTICMAYHIFADISTTCDKYANLPDTTTETKNQLALYKRAIGMRRADYCDLEIEIRKWYGSMVYHKYAIEKTIQC
jgi:hypothetical protein